LFRTVYSVQQYGMCKVGDPKTHYKLQQLAQKWRNNTMQCYYY